MQSFLTESLPVYRISITSYRYDSRLAIRQALPIPLYLPQHAFGHEASVSKRGVQTLRKGELPVIGGRKGPFGFTMRTSCNSACYLGHTGGESRVGGKPSGHQDLKNPSSQGCIGTVTLSEVRVVTGGSHRLRASLQEVRSEARNAAVSHRATGSSHRFRRKSALGNCYEGFHRLSAGMQWPAPLKCRDAVACAAQAPRYRRFVSFAIQPKEVGGIARGIAVVDALHEPCISMRGRRLRSVRF